MTDERDTDLRPPPTHVIGEALDTLSIDDITHRIATMRAEILRLEAAIDRKRAALDQASAFFKT